MIHATIGLMGGGKTYMAIHQIERQLLRSKRWVVTNLTEIDVPAFQAYLTGKYPEENINLAQRLCIIEKTASNEWYRYRGAFTMDKAPYGGVKPKGMGLEEFDAAMEGYFRQVNEKNPHGVSYFIDEAHRHFRAVDWAQIADIGIFYFTQHRHLNDEFTFITQFPEQVIPFLRRAAQDCILMRNHYVETFWLWQKPGALRWYACHGVPETKGKFEPYDSGALRIDKKGIGACYKTRGALGGAVSSVEDRPIKRKLPFWTVGIAAAVVAALAIGLIWSVPSLVSGVFGHFVKASGASINEALGQPAKKSAPVAGQKADIVPEKTVVKNETGVSETKKPLTVVGVLVRGQRLRAHLSDGRLLTETDGVRAVDERGLHLSDGTLVPYAKAESRPVVVRPSVKAAPVEVAPVVVNGVEEKGEKVADNAATLGSTYRLPGNTGETARGPVQRARMGSNRLKSQGMVVSGPASGDRR